MTKKTESVIRISFDITETLHRRSQIIPWGLKGMLLESLLDTVIKGIEDQGDIMIGAILNGHYSLVPIQKLNDKSEDEE